MDKDAKTDALRRSILDAALRNAAFDGWTEAALVKAAEDAGVGRAAAKRLFPDGIAGLLDFHLQEADRAMLEAMKRGLTPRMRVPARIAFAIRARLDRAAPIARPSAALSSRSPVRETPASRRGDSRGRRTRSGAASGTARRISVITPSARPSRRFTRRRCSIGSTTSSRDRRRLGRFSTGVLTRSRASARRKDARAARWTRSARARLPRPRASPPGLIRRSATPPWRGCSWRRDRASRRAPS